MNKAQRRRAEARHRNYREDIAQLPARPKPISARSGCKVSWATYATEAEAEIAARYAYIEGEYRAEEGYDFGYCCPGSVTKVTDGWEVCFP